MLHDLDFVTKEKIDRVFGSGSNDLSPINEENLAEQ